MQAGIYVPGVNCYYFCSRGYSSSNSSMYDFNLYNDNDNDCVEA